MPYNYDRRVTASDFQPHEKHGEWNFTVRPNGRRLSVSVTNPSGGGGSAGPYPSLRAALSGALASVGWGSPAINPQGKDRVWVVIVDVNGEPTKSYWLDVPKELMAPRAAPTKEELEYKRGL